MSYLDFVAAADSSNMKAGGTSFMQDPLTAIGTTAAGAVVSGLGSIYNTGVDVSNKVFGTNAERLDTGEVLNSIDTKWGNYYGEHKEVIDTLGFVGASFIPGGLAIKGLKLAREGEMFGTFSKVLGIASSRQASYTEKALQEVAQAGGSVFSQINTSKLASMAWGTADQVLQTFAFETAVAITMKASPMLDNADIKDIGWDVLKTSVIGGALGGGIEALFTNKLLKNAGKLVDAKKREYDIIGGMTNTPLSIGDKAFSIVDSVLALPKEVLEGTTQIPFKGAKAGFLETKGLMERTLRGARDTGLQDFEASLTKVVGNDYTIGRPLAESLLSMVKQGMEAGKDSAAIRTKLGEYLFNLEKVEAIGTRAGNFAEDTVYLTPKAKLSDKTVQWGKSAPDDPSTIAYRVIGDTAAARTAVLGEKGLARVDDAWKAGFDIVIDPVSEGTVHINPGSGIYQRISRTEAEAHSTYLNTKTLKTADSAVPTISDIAKIGEEVTVKGDVVAAGNRSFRFNTQEASPAVDSVEATARHLWASQLKRIEGSVEATDISVMDRLLTNPLAAADDLQIFIPGRGSVAYKDIDNFEQFAFGQKLQKAAELVQKRGAEADLRETAYMLNVTGDWLEQAIAHGFDAKATYNIPGWARPLEEYSKRENLILRYNTKGMENAKQSADALIAYKTRVKEASDKAQAIGDAVLGTKVSKQLLSFEGSITKDANELGNGASLLGAANANYFDRAAVWAQHTGTVVAKAIQDRVEQSLAVFQTPAAKLLKDPSASAEITALTTKLRTSTEGLGLYQDPMSSKWLVVDLPSLGQVNSPSFKGFATRMELSDTAGEFMAAHHRLHQERISQYQALAAAQGVPNHWNPDHLYAPPIDTQRVPFFAFVRQSDGTMFGTSEVGMITARDSAELKRLADQVERDHGLKVIYKADTEAFHKAKGDYDFQRTLNAPMIDSTLRSQGKLGDYLPSFVPQDVVEDYVRNIQRQETKIVRDAVSVRYGQTFAELQSLSARATAAQTSKMEGLGKLFTRSIVDPFGDYLKTAMNISKRGEFTLWHQMNEFVDALGTKAYRGIEGAFLDAKDGKISWEQANAKLEQFGVGAHFKDSDMFSVAQTAGDRNLIKLAMNKANMLLANGLLRLDFANSLMNMVSTPILLGTEVASIRRSLKNDPDMFAVFNAQLQQAVPGTEMSVPSTTKMLFKAIANTFGEEGKLLRERYKAIGAIKDQKSLFHDMVDEISLTPKLVPSEWAKKVDGWVEKGASITFNNQAEELTRFVSADVMRQITEPLVKMGKMAETEQNAFINIFVNRVQGNYVASQRPILFQGTLGSAIGLFQTYQFNLYQQLFRHIEHRDLKTIAVMGGLQSSLYGLNGLPLFDAINTHVVGTANINANHRDMYSMAVQAAGKDVGDWMMYGTASAFPLFSDKAPALYTRGDLNPRNATIIPVSPLDVPAVQASMKVATTVVSMGQQIAAGSSLSGALLFGLEHNGLNRPLAGLAQVVSGRSTTSSGALISSSSDMASITTLARLMGSRPMDEAIGLNTIFRNKSYQAADKARIETIGTVIKDKLRNNQKLTPEDWTKFQGDYAAAGGTINGYAAALQRWDTQSNTSIINDAMAHNQSAAGKRLTEVMGGSGVEDYNNPSGFDQ